MMDAVELLGHVEVSLTEPAILALLLVEGLHHPHARDRVGQHLGHPRPLAPRAQEQPVDALAVRVDRPAEQRHRQRHHQPQTPVEADQHGAQADEHDQRQRHVHHAEGQELPQPIGIRAHPRDQAPGLVTGVEAETEPLQVLEEVRPQVAGDPLA